MQCDSFSIKNKKRGPHVIYEYYENGRLKSEISMKDSVRQGITKNYDKSGHLLSKINYENNQMHGVAINYYPSGRVHSKIIYQEGRKNGNEIWYYESGKVFRISPFINGKLNGVQQFYYESGSPMAEVPYKNGKPGAGLKEYNGSGQLITRYPQIVIREINHLATENKFMLKISLSNKSDKVNFYMGKLEDDRYFDNSSLTPLVTKNGEAEYYIYVFPGSRVMEKMNIIANYKTPRGNPYIIQKKYNLAVKN
jgi:antitoxin component YwqK of YwqJK toxin-antitoxin module